MLLSGEREWGRTDRSTEPTGVVETGSPSSPVRRSDFDGISWSGHGHDGNTESEDESRYDELSKVMRGRSNYRAYDDDCRTRKHCLPSTESIRSDSGEWSADHRATWESACSPHQQVIHVHSIQGEDDRDHTTGSARLEDILEMRHGDDGSHERSIVSVGTSTTKGHKDRV